MPGAVKKGLARNRKRAVDPVECIIDGDRNCQGLPSGGSENLPLIDALLALVEAQVSEPKPAARKKSRGSKKSGAGQPGEVGVARRCKGGARQKKIKGC